MSEEAKKKIRGQEIGEKRPVTTLCVDIIGSTLAGLKMTEVQYDQFLQGIVTQIDQYLGALRLEGAIIKFTGDGWLVMSSKPHATTSLVVLAKTLCSRFEDDIRELMTSPPATIPGLRAAICESEDMAVAVPIGEGREDLDWVGDSARLASRSADYCKKNELLVDYTIKDRIRRTFDTEKVDLSARSDPKKKTEEEIELFAVQELKPGDIAGHRAEDILLKFLNWTGRLEQAKAIGADLVRKIKLEIPETPALTQQREISSLTPVGAVTPIVEPRLKRLLSGVPPGQVRNDIMTLLRELGSPPDVYFFSKQIAIAPDYEDAVQWYEQMLAADIAPNEVTFNTLINRSGSHEDAVQWYEQMLAADIAPHEVTFSTLINRAGSYEDAVQWYEQMLAADIAPHEVTTICLANKVPNFEVARQLTDRLRRDGSFRGEGYYSAVFSKVDVKSDPAELLAWYFEQDYRHAKSLGPVIKKFTRAGYYEKAMEFVVRFPHLDASNRFMRIHQKEFLDRIDAFLKENTTVHDGLYALGIFHYNNGQNEEAQPILREALELATAEPRRKHINSMLESIDAASS